MAIEVAKNDSSASSTVLTIAKSSANLAIAQAEQQESEPRDRPMTDVDECCPCWTRRCTCACLSCWKLSCCYRAWRTVRLRTKLFVEHKYFEWTILIIILASSVTLVSRWRNYTAHVLSSLPWCFIAERSAVEAVVFFNQSKPNLPDQTRPD